MCSDVQSITLSYIERYTACFKATSSISLDPRYTAIAFFLNN